MSQQTLYFLFLEVDAYSSWKQQVCRSSASDELRISKTYSRLLQLLDHHSVVDGMTYFTGSVTTPNGRHDYSLGVTNA